MILPATTPPTESGWYKVTWEPGDKPVLVYLTVNTSGEILWGWDESDDPECIWLDIADPTKIEYRALR